MADRTPVVTEDRDDLATPNAPTTDQSPESRVFVKANALVTPWLIDPLLKLDDIELLCPAAAHACVVVYDHLVDEERSGGLFDVLEQETPRLIPSVRHLRRDHHELRRIVRRAHRYARLRAPVAVQRVALRWLASAMRFHSARERATVQEAMLVDIGGESGPCG